jgi:uncharacterized damage-inducible protein DinB
VTSVLLELVRHKTWATRKFIELCQSLDTALVDATSPGTYGTIRQTLVHLVNADRNYFRRISGEEPWDKMGEQTTDLQTVAAQYLEIATHWESLAEDASVADRVLFYPASCQPATSPGSVSEGPASSAVTTTVPFIQE